MTKPVMLAILMGLAMWPSQGFAAAEAWQISRQSGTYGEAVTMSAFADADNGPGRINLYCDTRDGFRVMIFPHRLAMTAGSGHVVLTIDGGAPVTLTANAFGDEGEETEVVTVYDTGKIEDALAGAAHVAARFIGYDNSTSETAFTFDGMGAEKQTVLKVCPVSR